MRLGDLGQDLAQGGHLIQRHDALELVKAALAVKAVPVVDHVQREEEIVDPANADPALAGGGCDRNRRR